jgi:hypothetical protein
MSCALKSWGEVVNSVCWTRTLVSFRDNCRDKANARSDVGEKIHAIGDFANFVVVSPSFGLPAF